RPQSSLTGGRCRKPIAVAEGLTGDSPSFHVGNLSSRHRSAKLPTFWNDSLRLAIDLGVSCDIALRDFPQPRKERPDLFGAILKISHGRDVKLSKQVPIWGIETVLLYSRPIGKEHFSASRIGDD